MKKLIFLFLLFSIQFYLFSQNPRTILPVSSPVYQMIDNIYYESGFAQPETARPWSYSELSSTLDRIDFFSLSKAGKEAYGYIQGIVNWDEPLVADGNFSFDSGINLTPEGFYHFEIEDSLEEPPEAYDWNHGYEERKSFLTIPLEFWYGNSLYMISQIEVKEEYRTVTSPSTPDVAGNYFNVLFDDPNPRLDLYFPFRAVLSLGGDWWDIYFGRDDLSWGNGVSGNLMLSDYSDFYDFLELKTRSKIFTFTSIYSVMDKYLPNEDRFDGETTPYSAFMSHRLEARFLDGKIQAAVNESVTFSNYLPEIIRDLNYLMIFHNWTIPERTNSLMSFELSINPWKYMNIYGQLAMDEFATKYETDRDGGGGPPIWGYLAGIKGAYPVDSGYLSFVGEWAQTSPWLYNRRTDPYFYNTRRYWSLVTDTFEYVTKPLGYEYGSDSIVYYFRAKYSMPGLFSAGMDLTRLLKGETDIGNEWDPQIEDVTPTGTPEKKWILHLFGEYMPFSFLSVGADFYWSDSENADHIIGAVQKNIELAGFISLNL